MRVSHTAVAVALCLATRTIAAQPLSRPAPAALTWAAVAPRPIAGDRAAARPVRVDSAGRPRPARRWYWYTLGGAAVGAGGTVALILANCDAGCRDDGAMGAPVYVTAGAAVGAAAGTAVGLLVDHARGRRAR